MSRDGISLEEIKERLRDMAEAIAWDCLSSGKVQGSRIFGDCNGKCSVTIKGAMAGTVGFWQGQMGSKQGGSLIDLIAISRGMSFGEATRFAKQHYLGIQDKEFTAEEKREFARRRDEAEARKRERERQEVQEKERRSNDVRAIWQQCKPIPGTPAEAYLMSRVGDYDWPPSLRFHPSLPCELTKFSHPCLVAAVQGPDRSLIAIWRIFLTDDGKNLRHGGEKVKMGLGRSSGGVVRLTAVLPEWNVGEGLESTLGAWALSGWCGSWAASLSTSGMRGFQIPDPVKRVHLWSDGDKPRIDKRTGELRPPPGQGAAQAKAGMCFDAGIPAVVHEPPEDSDWLDVWQRARQ